MHVQFFRIKADSVSARTDYIAAKLTHSPSCAPRARHWAEAVDTLGDGPALEDVASWPKLSPAQRKAVQRRIACAGEMVERFLPLADGEVVEEDLYSYLTADWEHAPQGTPVLRRTTNQAVVFCFFDEMRVFPDETPPLRPVVGDDVEPAPDVPAPAGAVEVEAVELVEEIALDLAKALLEKLASFAIEQVMGDRVPSYFGQVYAEIGRIIAEALDAHMIREITDDFSGAQTWNNNHYLPLKRRQPPPPVQQLAEEMYFTENSFYFYLSKLKDPAVAHVCLGEFMIGASIHLAFVQELYTLTGATNWKEELSLNATLWAAHVEDAWKVISQARADQVKVQTDGDCVPVNGATKCSYYYTTYDYLTRVWGSKFFYRSSDDASEKAAKNRAQTEAASRRLAVIDELRVALGKPEETVAKWRQLSSL